MKIDELSKKYNIPWIQFSNFLKSHGKTVDLKSELEHEDLILIEDNLDKVKKCSIFPVTGLDFEFQAKPKILGKIQLPIDNDRHVKSSFNTLTNDTQKRKLYRQELKSIYNAEARLPRLLTFAKEFNIGKDTLVDFLIKNGYMKEELKDTMKLTVEMYQLCLKEFNHDKKLKEVSNSIEIPKSEPKYISTTNNEGKNISNQEQLDLDNSFKETFNEDLTLYFQNEVYSKELNDHNLGDSNNNFPQSKILKHQKSRFMYQQKILFGSPGTGKSFAINTKYLGELNINKDSPNCVKTVFHPEYTYGDFMGKLMPNTNDKGEVEYKFYEGHFLKALAQAFKNILDSDDTELPKKVALIIDEINRGNSAAIFGTVFQLLDREHDGWSSYEINISDLEFSVLLKLIGIEKATITKKEKTTTSYEYEKIKNPFDKLKITEDLKIKLPPNFSIIATMNTSDTSIYFMDSAFKRRWDWEFIDITSHDAKEKQINRILFDGSSWSDFVDNLNLFIKQNGKRIRKIEDKQIGYYFIKEDIITKESIKNKLQFFLWDSIFSNDKQPLEQLIGQNVSLITFGDFIRNCDFFINAIKSKSFIQV